MKKLIGYLILIFLVFFYLFHPLKYDYTYILLCGFLYVILTFIYYKLEKKTNYFDFDSVFILVYFIATQYFQIFLHNTNLVDRYFVFLFGYDENLLPQASGLSLLGLGAYLSGSLIFKEKKKNVPNSDFSIKLKKNTSNNVLYILSILSFLGYFAFGGYQRMIDLYAQKENIAQEVGIASYLFALCPAFLIVAIIIEFVQIKNKYNRFSIFYFSKLGMSVISIIIFSILITGSRTLPMQLILVVIGLYTYLFKPFRMIKFFTYIAAGIFVLFLVAVMRGAFEGNNNFIASDVISDIVGVVRASFAAIEYTNKHDYTYGESMLSPLLSPIPFAQNFFINVLGFKYEMMSSSLLYTYYTLGKVENLGFGTNIVADLYFSFGSFGVCFFMFLLGRFIKIISMRGRYNIYTLTAYSIMMSYCVFLVRAEFFFFLRFLLWSLIIMVFTIRFKRII